MSLVKKKDWYLDYLLIIVGTADGTCHQFRV